MVLSSYSWLLKEYYYTYNSTCSDFTSQELLALTVLRASLSTVSAVACLTVAVLILWMKAHRHFVQRLTLYASLSAFFDSIASTSSVIPVFYEDNKWSRYACSAIGFLFTYMVWTLMLNTFWIINYFLVLSAFQVQLNKRKYEIIGILAVYVLPLTFSWLPFLQGLYGPAGGWCWIETHANCSRNFSAGLVYQVGMFFGPFAFLAGTGCIEIVAIVCLLVRHRLSKNLRNQVKKALKEVLPLFLYAVFQEAVTIINTVNFICYAIDTIKNGNKPIVSMWILEVVLSPLSPALICLVFTVHHKTFKRMQRTIRKFRYKLYESSAMETARKTPPTLASNTEYLVPNDDDISETEPLIIRGSSDSKDFN